MTSLRWHQVPPSGRRAGRRASVRESNGEISGSTWYPDRHRNDDRRLTWQAPSVSQRRLEVHEHSKLLQQNGNGDVAVKREDPAILQAEYVAARRAHHLAAATSKVERALSATAGRALGATEGPTKAVPKSPKRSSCSALMLGISVRFSVNRAAPACYRSSTTDCVGLRALSSAPIDAPYVAILSAMQIDLFAPPYT